MNFLSLLGLSWLFYKQNFKTIVLLGVLFYFPINILAFFIKNILTGNHDHDIIILVLYYVFAIFLMIVQYFPAMIIIYKINSSVNGEDINVQRALSLSAKKLGKVITTSIIASAIVYAWTLLLIIPGIIFAGYYSMVYYIALLEDKSEFAALKYSKEIVKGNWWFTVTCTCFLLAAVYIFGRLVSLSNLFFQNAFIDTVLLSTVIHILEILPMIGGYVLYIYLKRESVTV